MTAKRFRSARISRCNYLGQRENACSQTNCTPQIIGFGCNRFGYNLDLIDLTLFFPKNHSFSSAAWLECVHKPGLIARNGTNLILCLLAQTTSTRLRS